MNAPRTWRRALGLLAGLFLCAPSFGAIDVIPKEIKLQDKPVTVRIVNNGERPEYVSIALSRLLNPGVPLDDEKLEPVSETAKPALYASPFRMALATGQTKTITLQPIHSVDAETVYRLDVSPVLKVLPGDRQKPVGGVLVNLRFSTLVRQLPKNERASLSVTCEPSGARLTATGNVRYEVKGATLDGKALDPFNVYPGQPLPLEGHNVRIPEQATCSGGASESK